MEQRYDSFLLVSFGGPEGPDDVLPFLENVLRGKNVPRQRMLEVAEHYQHFGGVSPINAQNRALLKELKTQFARYGIELPIYWGNRNWNPLLPDTLRQMRDDGMRRSIAFFTSMFSSYSGCRQYRENIIVARESVGEGAPEVDRLRMGFNHPGFIEAMSDRVRLAIDQLVSLTSRPRQDPFTVLFTAHSIPMSMANCCRYLDQLHEACRLVALACDIPQWELVFQSRSGPPTQPWLEPDVCDRITEHRAANSDLRLVIAPIGFISDHIEVLFDLDEEATDHCRQLGVPIVRAGTVGTHPEFVRMIVDLVQERLSGRTERLAIGEMDPWHDVCPIDCCLMGDSAMPSRRPS
jgi:ferrochelatase